MSNLVVLVHWHGYGGARVKLLLQASLRNHKKLRATAKTPIYLLHINLFGGLLAATSPSSFSVLKLLAETVFPLLTIK